MSTRELQYTPYRSSAQPTIRIFFANASRYQCLPDGSGYHYSLTLRDTMILSCRRPLNGNPTCQRGSYSTRTVAHPHSQPSTIFFANASRYQGLPDGSGYHYLLTLRVAMVFTGRRPRNGNPKCKRGSYSTTNKLRDGYLSLCGGSASKETRTICLSLRAKILFCANAG